jgi:hypothetical protein
MGLTRRFFLKIASLLSLFSLGKGTLFGEETTENPCDLKNNGEMTAWPEEKIYFWVDGLLVPGVESRASLAILLKHPQTPNEYIDKVVLSDSDSETRLIGARYFSPEDKIAGGGFPPYILFDNLNFEELSPPLALSIQIRTPIGLKRYRYVFPRNIKKSALDRDYLPAQVKEDLRTSHRGGRISGVYEFESSLPIDNFGYHLVKAKLIQIDPNGAFTIQVPFLHGPEEGDHYSRYCLVTDPVGRILGIEQRDWKGPGNAFTISQLSEDHRNNKWLLTRDSVAQIQDCPYVMVFVEDVKEALVRGTIWLK